VPFFFPISPRGATMLRERTMSQDQMSNLSRAEITLATKSTACALFAFSSLALAQSAPDVECRKTETQAECHARLHCKPNEELEECQKRLLKCRANEKLEDCKRRVAREGRDRDQGSRDREADQGSRERVRDREDRERRDRDEGADARRRDDDGERRRDSSRGGRGFQASRTFGLGLELGEPSGINGKYFLSEKAALDFGLGLAYGHYYYGNGFHIYADFLYHPLSLVSARAFDLPFYVGGGLRFWNFRYCDGPFCNNVGSAVGIRVPVGISLDFKNVPLDVFIEVVPVLDFVSGNYYFYYGYPAHFGVDGSVGIRYWFF
jgi:hypothetical protein